ncbi:methionine--tRNA ligase [Sedimentisphaera salicampi]|uniref:Methionine--tRNA ligase n=1 Tax=Sedimentisphaera salicampi TaxID=1941349 RepID=A0A1W6LNF6_9BACT|nr:methionine--tRNA ligase [Sedimentisphaera salicampi]ARN57273.1 Methionine--tRNA ligase [Sedimentisphaera salicampi]OXU14590.1 Methionine--tRNA ligase [Sedimentisphaera salicampi]
MPRNIVVTSALPYANGPIHIGHLVEYIQTDIWVRFQKLSGNRCLYFCADDTHGTPIMLSARKQGIKPEELIEKVHSEHRDDFSTFGVEFENYYTTHSPENRELSSQIFLKLKEKGSIETREVAQAYCESCSMFLPDRFIVGKCPKCGAEEQYGDSCDKCGSTYSPTELINPRCAICGGEPTTKTSKHYFFRLGDYENQLKEVLASGHAHPSVLKKLDEWFDAGLRDWDISRDGPYFGFRIPGEENKFFYVWLDAPIGYMASCKNWCDKNGFDLAEVWNSPDWELYHFIGKDIMYFHALFWPAMLMGSGNKIADKLFVHGFLTVDGEKMSKSKGTFIKAKTFQKHLNPECLRYYYACKLSDGVEDIDLSLEDFQSRVNADLIGNLVNLASRSIPMLKKKLGGQLGEMDEEGREMVNEILQAKDSISQSYETLKFSQAVRQIINLAGSVNRYFDKQQPWITVKEDKDKTLKTLTAVVNAVNALNIYIKPVVPKLSEKLEKILGCENQGFKDIAILPEGHEVNKFKRLMNRIEKENIEAMIEESKSEQENQQTEQKPENQLDEPLAPECSFDDFMKVDLRVAEVKKAEPVEGADKLLHLQLDIGGITKNVFAGISKAYKPEDLEGRLVVCVANLAPRKMRFGVSEGMVVASGPGGEDVFLLSPDSGAKPGQRVH